MTNTEFIESIAPAARSDMATSGILASITIAQACLESVYGTSELAFPVKTVKIRITNTVNTSRRKSLSRGAARLFLKGV